MFTIFLLLLPPARTMTDLFTVRPAALVWQTSSSYASETGHNSRICLPFKLIEGASSIFSAAGLVSRIVPSADVMIRPSCAHPMHCLASWICCSMLSSILLLTNESVANRVPLCHREQRQATFCHKDVGPQGLRGDNAASVAPPIQPVIYTEVCQLR